MSSSFVIFEGHSRLDGCPIVVIASGVAGSSANAKTGDMAQTWIMRADVHPVEAIRSGQDDSICGLCPHRGVSGRARSCYVNVGMAPSVLWKAYKAGKVPAASPDTVARLLRFKGLRIGAYGDPAAVPTDVWQTLVSGAAFHTGYTHQWRTAADLRGLVMASCDTPADLAEAEAAGWRAFYVIGPDAPNPPAMRRCPSDPSLDSVHVPCAACRACDGANSARQKGHRFIRVHGNGKKYFALNMA